jgi:hypothetical protein
MATIGVLFLASRKVSFERKPMVDHLLLLGLFVILISATVMGLSLAGHYTRLMLPQWLLYMAISTVGYRVPSTPRQTSPVHLDIELGVAPTARLHDDLNSPHLNSQQSTSSLLRVQTTNSLAMSSNSASQP